MRRWSTVVGFALLACGHTQGNAPAVSSGGAGGGGMPSSAGGAGSAGHVDEAGGSGAPLVAGAGVGAVAGSTGEFAPRIADTRGDVLLAKGDRAGALKEYLAARASEDNGRIDFDLLDLKIRDLGGTPPATPGES